MFIKYKKFVYVIVMLALVVHVQASNVTINNIKNLLKLSPEELQEALFYTASQTGKGDEKFVRKYKKEIIAAGIIGTTACIIGGVTIAARSDLLPEKIFNKLPDFITGKNNQKKEDSSFEEDKKTRLERLKKEALELEKEWLLSLSLKNGSDKQKELNNKQLNKKIERNLLEIEILSESSEPFGSINNKMVCKLGSSKTSSQNADRIDKLNGEILSYKSRLVN